MNQRSDRPAPRRPYLSASTESQREVKELGEVLGYLRPPRRSIGLGPLGLVCPAMVGAIVCGIFIPWPILFFLYNHGMYEITERFDLPTVTIIGGLVGLIIGPLVYYEIRRRRSRT